MKKHREMEIIESYLANPNNPDIRKQFESWLKEHPDHKAKYRRYLETLNRIKSPEPQHIPDAQIVWSRLEDQLGFSSDENVFELPKRKAGNLITKRVMAIAASLIVVALAYFSIRPYLAEPRVYTAGASEIREVMLPDQSLVQLNAQSEIRLDPNFNETQRKLYLSGQAFFRVTDAGKPFLVQTDNGLVEVMGTAFDVKNRYDRTEVVVREGLVKITSVYDHDSLLLRANERSVIEEDHTIRSKEAVDAAYMIGWLDNRFVFDQTPLTEAVDEIERRYGVDIKIAGTRSETLSMSGSYAYKSIDSTLQSFCLALDLKFNKENGTYIIRDK